jgi:hypothetical protein
MVALAEPGQSKSAAQLQSAGLSFLCGRQIPCEAQEFPATAEPGQRRVDAQTSRAGLTFECGRQLPNEAHKQVATACGRQNYSEAQNRAAIAEPGQNSLGAHRGAAGLTFLT